MSAFTTAFAQNRKLGWAAVAAFSALLAVLVGINDRQDHQKQRLTLLQAEVQRNAVELMSQTLNGKLMGAVTLLGLNDRHIKQEVSKGLMSIDANIPSTLSSLGHAFEIDGVYLVNQDGIVTTSWDRLGQSTNGLDVSFRPYYKMAMRGQSSIYAAVNMIRGDRSLYFSAPVVPERARSTIGIGAVVARTDLGRIDALLAGKFDVAALISPQRVIFASNRAEWTGAMDGAPTAVQLRQIRDLRQFGSLFEKSEPKVLPIHFETGIQQLNGQRFAIATAAVNWNDPAGDWQLLVMDDLSKAVPITASVTLGAGVGLLSMMLGWLFVTLFNSRYAQKQANLELQTIARQREDDLAHREQLAASFLLMQQSKTPHELASIFLSEAHRVIGALQGVVYTFQVQVDKKLHLLATFAVDGELPAVLERGEGLLGQCASEQKIMVIDTVPDGHGVIRSGLGAMTPAALMMAPILHNQLLLGVLEVAMPCKPGQRERDGFEELTRALAMNLQIVERALDAADMLSATRAAQQDNLQQLEFQQVLIDAIPYPLFTKDAEARYIGVNRAYEEALGTRRETLLGKRAADLEFVPEPERLTYQAEDESTIASAGSIRREMQLMFVDGKTRDVMYFASGFCRPDGSPGGLVGTFIDISAIKSAELAQEHLADIERFNRLALDRETRILELKREINELDRLAGRSPRFAGDLIETVGDHVPTVHPDYAMPPQSTSQTPLQLGDLIDLEEMQKLFAGFCEAIGVPAAIIDLQGKVLASSKWQRACTDFHRVNVDSCARCIESDTGLALKLQEGADFTMYKCKNGMIDCASPILVDGQHLANVFIGQFHVTQPDVVFFRQQANKFNYPEADYLQAVTEAPVLDEKRLPVILGFLTGFTRMVSETSLAKHRADQAQQILERQAALLRQERLAAMSLAEDAQMARQALEQRQQEPKV